ncbi:hypothetical protein BJ878DRAFT_512173 [Calycina marina]|uniref:Uncharacterized protein n=1 Tax=Calycina marina TaxID=1763456 RepID=A0A9P7Z0L5_9HELO|nr:hypothetical protein BJ878DRAFT_512173 [Calycina marina]
MVLSPVTGTLLVGVLSGKARSVITEGAIPSLHLHECELYDKLIVLSIYDSFCLAEKAGVAMRVQRIVQKSGGDWGSYMNFNVKSWRSSYGRVASPR